MGESVLDLHTIYIKFGSETFKKLHHGLQGQKCVSPGNIQHDCFQIDRYLGPIFSVLILNRSDKWKQRVQHLLCPGLFDKHCCHKTELSKAMMWDFRKHKEPNTTNRTQMDRSMASRAYEILGKNHPSISSSPASDSPSSGSVGAFDGWGLAGRFAALTRRLASLRSEMIPWVFDFASSTNSLVLIG